VTAAERAVIAELFASLTEEKEREGRKIKIFSRTHKRCYLSARRRRQILDLSRPDTRTIRFSQLKSLADRDTKFLPMRTYVEGMTDS
jgi:hypothetical protein